MGDFENERPYIAWRARVLRVADRQVLTVGEATELLSEKTGINYALRKEKGSDRPQTPIYNAMRVRPKDSGKPPVLPSHKSIDGRTTYIYAEDFLVWAEDFHPRPGGHGITHEPKILPLGDEIEETHDTETE